MHANQGKPNKGMFRATILGKCVGKIFFGVAGRDYGLARTDITKSYFEPLGDGPIALVCTTIKHAILEKKQAGESTIKWEGRDYIGGQYTSS